MVIGIATPRPYAEPARKGHTIDMRVVSGDLGGRKLVTPDGSDTRPTSDRVREAMFNSLFSLDAIEGARVLDAFAGSGALGIEALSRGALHATFVETGRDALAALRENLETLQLGAHVVVHRSARVHANLAAIELDRLAQHHLVHAEEVWSQETWMETWMRRGQLLVRARIGNGALATSRRSWHSIEERRKRQHSPAGSFTLLVYLAFVV